MISISTKGNFKRNRAYLESIKNKKLFAQFDQYGRMGVRALESATPQDTGETAQSWNYRVITNHRWPGIEWYNTNTTGGNQTPIAILIQYGHGTSGGGYVQGRDFINPAMRPVFDQILSELRKKVNP